MKIGVFYGSTTGNTEDVANKIVASLEPQTVLLRDVADATVEDFQSVDVLICGASTWDIGELQADWEYVLPKLEGIDLSGKVIAFFGLGDAESYAWNFLDCLGIIWKVLEPSGATLIGLWPTADYEFDESQGLRDDENFLGLALDEDNESEKTDERLHQWLAQVSSDLERLSFAPLLQTNE